MIEGQSSRSIFVYFAIENLMIKIEEDWKICGPYLYFEIHCIVL